MIRRSAAIALACGLASGGDYVVPALLANAQLATYLLRERSRGRNGTWQTDRGARHPLRSGMLTRAFVQSVRVGAVDKVRVFLVDSNFQVIATCDGQGLLSERVPFGQRTGFYNDRSRLLVGFHAPLRPRGVRLVRGTVSAIGWIFVCA